MRCPNVTVESHVEVVTILCAKPVETLCVRQVFVCLFLQIVKKTEKTKQTTTTAPVLKVRAIQSDLENTKNKAGVKLVILITRTTIIRVTRRRRTKLCKCVCDGLL